MDTLITALDLDMNGSSGSDLLTGAGGNDKIFGGAREDTLNGGAGNDSLNGGSGDDTLVYNLSANVAAGTSDVYMGGSGKDTLVLEFTLAQWLASQTQEQIASYLAHLATVTNARTEEVSNGTASDFVFMFGGSRLTIQMMEKLRVFVDGTELTAADDPVVAAADGENVSEDAAAISIQVLANDSVPDLVSSLSLETPAAHGTATLVKPDAAIPSTWYFQYTVDTAYYQYLAAGQTATDSFTYKVTDADSDFDIETVTITITGTNDVVSITSAAQSGAVVEDADSTPSGADSLSAAGTVAFTDVDLADSHIATAAAAPGNSTNLGVFALAPVSEAPGAAAGSVGWTYTLNNAAAQYLAAGATATETYTVTVNDGNGSTATQDVVITITGTNDAVTITSAAQAGTVVEDADTTPSGADSLSAMGTVAFSDVDLADNHTVSAAPALGNTTSLGVFALAVVSEVPGAAAGSVGWTYTLNNAAAQYLAAGATATETYTVTVNDGNGSTATQDVVITITGTNDEVMITSVAQAGAVVEDADSTPSVIDSLSATGTVAFADVDLADNHTATAAAAPGNSTSLGVFALAIVSEAPNAATGSVGWTYTLNNAAAQYLAAGATASETYAVTMDDGKGSTATQDVVITITGTNDEVTITSAAQAGTVVEDADTTPSNTDSLSATGTVAFSDVDLADGHAASAAPAPGNTTSLGLFALAVVSEPPGAAVGSVGWTYTLNNAAAQYLAAGAVVSETYTVTVDDGNGSTAAQDVVITINGTNDEVTITSAAQAGGVVEDADTTPSGTDSLSATGTVAFSDVDLADSHTASAVPALGNTTSLGVFALAAVTEAANAAAGSVGWTYTLNNAAAQYLAAGAIATETYTVTVDDGKGSTVTQDVVITITGTNDAVTITSAAQAGTVVEDADTTPSGTDSLSATGTVAFTDADLADSHAASAAPAPENTTSLGEFALASVSEAANAAAGSVGWTYTLNNAAAQYLAAGATATETHTVTVNDGNGSTATQDVVITITGTNDEVMITSVAQAGAVVEDADTTPSGSDSLSATGTVAFADVDLADNHTASAAPAPGNSTSLGVFALGSVSEAPNAAAGSVGWTYTLNNAAAQYLAAGAIVSETYTVTVNDGNGSTATQDVVITITGTNDEVTITSVAQSGAVVEDADTTLSGTDSLSATGTVAFTDADLADSHAASATPAPGNTTSLGVFALAVVSEAPGAAAGSVDWTYTLSNAAANYLAAGAIATETYIVTVNDGNGSTATQDVVITITGTNDAPTLQVLGTDSAAKTLVETNGGLTSSGTLTARDADLADTLASSVTGVTLGGTTGTLTAAQVLGFLTVTPSSGLAGNPADSNNLAWSFNSGSQAFNYLAAGNSLVLDYTVQTSDGNGGSGTQQVSITITGTADGPTDIVLSPAGNTPGGNNLPTGTIGQLSAVGATGSVSYGSTLVEKDLAGTVLSGDGSPDVTVSASGLVTGVSGGSGFEEARVYELSVTATDGGGSLLELFRIVTGSANGETITLPGIADDLSFLRGGNDTIFAGGGDDIVFGQNDADQIHGGDGNDQLWGLNGNDVFHFDSALNALTNVDRIMDFDANGEKLQLSTAQFAGIGVGSGTLAAGNYATVNSGGTGDVSALSVAGTAARIVFDTSTRDLYYDADGMSLANATLFVTLTGLSGSLTEADITYA